VYLVDRHGIGISVEGFMMSLSLLLNMRHLSRAEVGCQVLTNSSRILSCVDCNTVQLLKQDKSMDYHHNIINSIASVYLIHTQ
jgi:hypothetical protein